MQAKVGDRLVGEGQAAEPHPIIGRCLTPHSFPVPPSEPYGRTAAAAVGTAVLSFPVTPQPAPPSKLHPGPTVLGPDADPPGWR